MPDISMCQNLICSRSSTCYRFTAKPNQYLQAYADFKPDKDGNCSYYWDNSGWVDKSK